MATFLQNACFGSTSRAARHGDAAGSFFGRAALGALSLSGVLAACTNRLDPSVLVEGEDGGGGELLATCSLFTIGENQYVICPEPLNYEDASRDCTRRIATLAAIGSDEENELVATSARSIVNENLWLGGTRDSQYVWRWPDGSVFWRGGPSGSTEGAAFVTWVPGEPNDSSTVTTDPERCLALTFAANGWNDRACSLHLPYICEHPPPGP
jgi:hypothetical protein